MGHRGGGGGCIDQGVWKNAMNADLSPRCQVNTY